MTAQREADLWTRLAARVAQALGLHFPPPRWPELQRGLQAAATRLGWPDDLPALLLRLEAPLTSAERDLLAAHLTIGETYFFRDPSLMALLAHEVLPLLVAERRGRDQRIAAWSAGCSSGEEAWSLAVLLRRCLPEPDGWQVEVHGTDINPVALRKAEAGAYGAWSFRGALAELQAGNFTRREDGRYEIAPQLRPLVAFHRHNLAFDRPPRAFQGTRGFDLVLCRNVLMYLAPEVQPRVVETLRGSLAEGGWLGVAAIEATPQLFEGLESVETPAGTLFRRRAAGTIPVIPVEAGGAPEFMETEALGPRLRGDDEQQQPPSPAPPDPGHLARQLANQGRLDEALVACERWLAARPLVAAAHHLHGAILAEGGWPDAARAAWRRALFLEPGFVLAHVALGELARQEGRAADAVRHFRQARRVLARYADSEPVPEGDGLTVGALARLLDARAEAEALP